jgi:hypothetical protein
MRSNNRKKHNPEDEEARTRQLYDRIELDAIEFFGIAAAFALQGSKFPLTETIEFLDYPEEDFAAMRLHQRTEGTPADKLLQIAQWNHIYCNNCGTPLVMDFCVDATVTESLALEDHLFRCCDCFDVCCGVSFQTLNKVRREQGRAPIPRPKLNPVLTNLNNLRE